MSPAPLPHGDTETAVRALVAAAGLAPSEEEMAALIAGYPELRTRMDTMHALAEARYESPALVFDPDPTFAEWDVPPEP